VSVGRGQVEAAARCSRRPGMVVARTTVRPTSEILMKVSLITLDLESTGSPSLKIGANHLVPAQNMDSFATAKEMFS